MDGLDAYGSAAFAVGAAAAGGLVFVSLLVVTITFLCFGRCESRFTAFCIAALTSFATMCLTALLAWVAGFDYLPPWAAFLLACVTWFFVVMFCMVMVGPSWRTAFLITSMAQKGFSGDDVEGASRRCSSLMSLGRAMLLVTLKNPIAFWISTVFAYIFSLAMVLALDGVCYCSNPIVITTWTSRRSDPHYCLTDEMCHVYATLGPVPTSLRIVSHVVTSGSRPLQGWVDVCESTSPDFCVGPTWSNSTLLFDHNQLDEDQRFLSHAFMTNLSASTTYRFTSYLRLQSESVVSRSILIRTVPALDSTEDVVMIGGGDYETDNTGIKMLRAAILSAPDAQILYVGGDLSYANNLRTCYLRWDSFLHQVATLLNKYRCNLPLLTILGNHESAGYLAIAPSSVNFYPVYFPMYENALSTRDELNIRTYHTHLVGKQLGIVGLDSNLIIPAQQQTAYLDQQLTLIRGVSANASSSMTETQFAAMRFAIVMYHNAVFSGSGAAKSPPVDAVKKFITPTIAAHAVPLVLEFHEHIFKRTLPIDANGNVQRASLGTVYIGDGAMGVWSKSRTRGSQAYLAINRAGNYANVIRVLSNGTAVVTSVDAGSDASPIVMLDQVSIDKRRF